MNDLYLPSRLGAVHRCALASAVGLAMSSTAYAQTAGEGAVLEKTRIESTDSAPTKPMP